MSQVRSKFPLRSVIAVTAIALITAVGCKGANIPVQFSVAVSAKNMIDFSAELTSRIGINLNASLILPKNLGSISVMGETPDHGFRLALSLATSSFIPAQWGGIEEVSSLPTGESFPAFISTPVAKIEIPALENSKVSWDVYLGLRGQMYVGGSISLSAIGSNIPQINLGYNFFDKQGRLILSIQFFPAKLRPNGEVDVPGGFFVGTNLTPLIPQLQQQQQASSSVARVASASSSQSSLSAVQNGKTTYTQLMLGGKDSRRVNSTSRLNKVMNAYLGAQK